MTQPLLVAPDTKVSLADYDPRYSAGYESKKQSKAVLKQSSERLQQLQQVLWAEGKHALLIVLQAMDAGGKDGTIKHVMRGVNPQGCQVTGFKVPSKEELAHDYLWRVHKATPRRGQIGIFNRSHYEDVLVVRVHDIVPQEVWQKRYDQINDFERMLAENGTTILKFFLHISKQEQKERFEARLQEPAKNWKFSMDDVRKRELWETYMQAYEDALSRCSTPWAPWFIVPADRKWYRNLVISETIVKALERLDMKYPPPLENADTIVIPD
jgi:PPK2 family polyphosphate:nucleotide phosphotransferase